LKCDFCGREEPLPFVCNYCGGAFCPDHRLPEAHQCRGDLTQRRTIIAPPQTTFSWQQSATTPAQAPALRQGKVFSRIEIRDIIIAWLALGVAFSFALAGGGLVLLSTLSVQTLDDAALLFLISLLTVGPGFVFHELCHKFVAQRYGYWAEFRMWPMGLVLALLSSLVFPGIFAAPGATYISGMTITRKENGWISVAGPIVNFVIAILFLPLLLWGGGLQTIVGSIGFVGFRVNSLLGVFNLIPFGPLDGTKVFNWNKAIWLAVLIPLLAAFAYSLSLG
jgi:Zn-dependent protease